MNDTFLAILKILSLSATFALMFGSALRLGPSALRQLVQRPAFFVRVLLAVWIAVPLLTAMVVLALRIEGTAAKTLLLMAGCPGVPLLLGTTRTVRGAMSTAFAALALTAATEPLLIPLWTRLASAILPVDLTVHWSHILRVLAPTILVPVAVGFVVRALFPRAVHPLVRASDGVYAVAIIGCVLALLAGPARLIPRVPLRALAGAAIITVGDAAIGYWAGWPDRDDRKAIALATAMGNPALAIAVVEASYPGNGIGPMAVGLYVLVRAICITPVLWWLRQVHDRRHLRRASAL
jgi:BASS family bile acid:Na+ symporter